MNEADQHRALTTTRVSEVAAFLEAEGVDYELVEHEPAMSAAAEGRVAGYPLDQVAKTVVLHDGAAYLVVAVPASERLDLHKLRELLGATRQLRLASESEIGRDFPSLEVGAIPLFGPMLPAGEVIDTRLLRPQRILCPAGDHRHSVLIDPQAAVRMTAATVADICVD